MLKSSEGSLLVTVDQSYSKGNSSVTPTMDRYSLEIYSAYNQHTQSFDTEGNCVIYFKTFFTL